MTDVAKLCQLYDEHGKPLAGLGGTKDDIFGKGMLHGAAHVWIWREKYGQREVLLQKRAAAKRTWPNLYDISAAGHIDIGEEPIEAATRETKEELNIDINPEELKLIDVLRTHLVAPDGSIENEFRWVYLFKLISDVTFKPREEELESVSWVTLDTFTKECLTNKFVPQGKPYYDKVIAAIKSAA
jgi:isopentenyl-diphosphate Delta-isomerase